MSSLADWQTFYEIMGSAAGALTGLQFVVMAIISEIPMGNGEAETGAAFATPSIVHFLAVLLTVASLAMPWHSFDHISIAWAVASLSGLVYTLIVIRRMRNQTAYKPVLEDWAFHAVLPCIAYAGLTVSALCMPHHAGGALFGFGGVCLLLLSVGIHNAWDNVIYLVILKRQRLKENLAPKGE
jgi:hypothetical protein